MLPCFPDCLFPAGLVGAINNDVFYSDLKNKFLCSLFPGLFVFRRIDYRQSHMYGAPQSLLSPFITGETFDDAI